MTTAFSRAAWFILVTTFVGLTDRSPVAASGLLSSFLSPDAVERTRAADVIEPAYRQCLESRPGETVVFWVFFTDKGVSDKAAFVGAAASVRLTDRALQRRAKVGLDRVVFVDLPVAPTYIRDIEALGARHRRSSRWLNAASFEADANRVEQIAQLPYVAEIRPMARFVRPPEEPTDEIPKETPKGSSQSTNSLNYGDSYAQLNQIGVPAAHDRGYTGAGVTLAILDTGHRKTHVALASHYAEGRVLAEYDFVYNDTNVGADSGDWASETSHGTEVFSVAAGKADGYLYGPAFGANFILCKTEDVRSELPVEEDNWVAAMEYADSIGTDVLTSSLGYLTFDAACSCSYSYADMDGQTATSSIAAGMADGLGIVVCKSAGNSGPNPGTITAPADAFNILAVGSVNSGGSIAASSSRGPTADGRIKPEVCARGVSTTMVNPSSDATYLTSSGTSFATPLVAGAACLIIEAHPDWTPYQVREALKHSGNRAASPDNTYGWGVINADSALGFWCCTGKVGNVNGSADEAPTLGDVSQLIDYLFITFDPPPCLGEADVNVSGGEFPQSDDITIGDISMLIDHLFITYASLPDCP